MAKPANKRIQIYGLFLIHMSFFGDCSYILTTLCAKPNESVRAIELGHYITDVIPEQGYRNMGVGT